jgi:hypothetical protein
MLLDRCSQKEECEAQAEPQWDGNAGFPPKTCGGAGPALKEIRQERCPEVQGRAESKPENS